MAKQITFEEGSKLIVHNQHRMAVYEMLMAHLQDYMMSDTSDEAKVLRLDDCLVPVVGEDVLDEVMQTLDDERCSSFATIEEINALVFTPKRKPRAKSTRKKDAE